jgi:hypothetical protein
MDAILYVPSLLALTHIDELREQQPGELSCGQPWSNLGQTWSNLVKSIQ